MGEETLKNFLAAHDVKCPSCGYNLRGVQGGSCPECAMPLDLDLVRDGPIRDQMSPLEGMHAEPAELSDMTGLALTFVVIAGVVLAVILIWRSLA